MGTGRVEKEGTKIPKTGSVSLVVPGEGGRRKTGSADCGGLLTPEEADGNACVFLVSHDDDGLSFRTSIVGQGDEEGSSVDTVGKHDMTGIGIRLAEALKRSEEEDSTPVVCFDSLTDLLRYNDEKASYMFMHLMTNRLRKAGGVGHVHLDPDVVGETTVRNFEPLFDGTVTEE